MGGNRWVEMVGTCRPRLGKTWEAVDLGGPAVQRPERLGHIPPLPWEFIPSQDARAHPLQGVSREQGPRPPVHVCCLHQEMLFLGGLEHQTVTTLDTEVGRRVVGLLSRE